MVTGRWTAPLPAFLSSHAEHPLMFRPGSTDPFVFDQVFVDLEYACFDGIPEPDVIVDCGANVGYSSAYFLTMFPNCRLAAVEPDPGNFAVLAANLAPYGERVTLFEGAIWPEPGTLAMSTADNPYRGGGEWARQATPDGSGALVRAFTIPEVIDALDASRINLLKVDVEGAEVELFGRETAWLDVVDRLAIEVHDDSSFGLATPMVEAAIGSAFSRSWSGELTVFERLSAIVSP